MKNIYLVVILLLFAGFTQSAVAQNISNEGLEFWTVFPTHDPSGTNLANMNVNVTSKGNSVVTVSCGTYTETQSIAPNTVATFIIPRPDSYIPYSDINVPLTNRGIHIVVSPGGSKVVAYSHVFASARSAATLILPYDALGQKYFSMNYTQDNPGRNFLAIVAADDNTNLILHKNDGTSLPITLLNKGDVYEYMPSSTEDLTGSFVEVDTLTSKCKRFAVFSGSTSVVISTCNNATSRDPLLQQLYSVNNWGKTYGVVPFINRRYIVRVLAQENNTKVTLNGSIVGILNRGQFYDQILTTPTIVAADKLISVAEYSFTVNCSSVTAGPLQYGDPEMVLLNPVEFNIKNITLFSSNMFRIREKYVNVFMKTNRTASFKLNGSIPTNATWQTMPFDPSYSWIQIQVYDESLTLTADEGFNAITYGFGDTESYAYSAGTNLASASKISLLNLGTGISSLTNACLGQETNPTLTVPYQLTKIIWRFDDGDTYADNTLASPVVTIDNVGAKQYTYTSNVRKKFSTTGTHPITATAILSVADLPPCIDGTDLEFNFEVEVVPLGNANFAVPDICAGTPVQFFDLSSVAGSTITQWKWEFDGQPETVKDPIHTFTQGLHIVRLSVANSSGCWSEVFEQKIPVNKSFPQLVFSKPTPICLIDNPLQLTVIEKLGLTASKTEFTGKGISASGLFDPFVAGVGTHKITYTFTSKDGCTDVISQDIEVYALTKIDVSPIVYILTGGQKVITAKIENPYSTYNYKYKWTPSIGLSKDDILNPIASPEKDTDYLLTISIDGLCDVSTHVLVKVLDQVKPPSAFSPNGDGVNDVWVINSLDTYPTAVVEVFNRNGQKVFTSLGYTVPFDGTYHNDPLPVGVYYYIINPKNGRKAITGPLTIIR